MFFPKRSVVLVALITGFLVSLPAHAAGPAFSVSFPKARSEKPLDGRIFLLLSTDPSAEPRMQIDDSVRTQMMFGMDVDGMQPGQAVTVDDSANGYPIRSLRDVPPGEYYVQAVLHRYETFHRSDGHTVKLPMDRGEGQHWNIAPGNLYSTPRKITLGPPPDRFRSCSIRKSRRFRRRRTRNTSGTSEDSERAAHQILGTSHVSQRQRAGARGI